MSEIPPQIPPNFQPNYGDMRFMQPTRTSGTAIASLVLGILGCIPVITGSVAIVLGIVGIRATREPTVKGRGLAIAGLILGLLSVVGWVGFGGLISFAYIKTAPDRLAGRAFVQDLSTGNVTAAHARCEPSVTTESLQTSSDEIQAFGPLKSVTFTSFNISTANGVTIANLGGVGMFAKGPKPVILTLSHSGGSSLVQSWMIK